MKELLEFDGWIQTAVNALSPSSRKQLYKKIAQRTRKANQANITKQQDPDGTKWEPRKKRQQKTGKVKRKIKMMMGLRAARRMKTDASSDGASIGFRGRNALIASVHHLGDTDRVGPDGPKVDYPQRKLLGFSNDLMDAIEDDVLDHLTGQK